MQDIIDRAWTFLIQCYDGQNVIIIWPFDSAPQELKDLSSNGGDEDWIAVAPHSIMNNVMFLEAGSSFGCCRVQEIEVGRWCVKIGSHA